MEVADAASALRKVADTRPLDHVALERAAESYAAWLFVLWAEKHFHCRHAAGHCVYMDPVHKQKPNAK